jgi:hypothetical protein
VQRVDPWEVAREGEGNAPIPQVALKANPNPGLAQLESWFWVDGYSGASLTWSQSHSASHTECRFNNGVSQCRTVDDSVTVNLRAAPKQYVWDYGDGRSGDDGHPSVFTDQSGLGRAYTDPFTPSYVLHKYVQSSLKFFDAGGFAIAVRITWSAVFSVNGGSWQQLPDLAHTFEARHQVRESWPVGVNIAINTVAP